MTVITSSTSRNMENSRCFWRVRTRIASLMRPKVARSRAVTSAHGINSFTAHERNETKSGTSSSQSFFSDNHEAMHLKYKCYDNTVKYNKTLETYFDISIQYWHMPNLIRHPESEGSEGWNVKIGHYLDKYTNSLLFYSTPACKCM